VASVFKYIQYGTGVTAGFLVTPSPLQSCDITMAGSCAPSRTLMVGLNDSLTAGFNTASLDCPPSNYPGPATINDYPVCQASIPGTTVSVSGASSGTLTTTVLFDSGTPSMVINVPSGTTFPASVPAGSPVTVETPSGFAFNYTAGAGTEALSTVVQLDVSAQSIVGVGYFTTNSFFTDFTSGTEGWK
jgi:hypothetical protein